MRNRRLAGPTLLLFALLPAASMGTTFPHLQDAPQPSCPAGQVPFYGSCLHTLRLFGQHGSQHQNGTGNTVVAENDFRSATTDLLGNNSQYQGAGVVVFRRAGAPDYIYIADTGNNRVLGFRSLGSCAISSATACTNNNDCPASGDSCTINPNRAPDIVLGANESACCNNDCNLGTRKTPTASNLCLFNYPQIFNKQETWQKLNFDVDNQGNIYVPDTFNNRVLRFNDPLSLTLTSGRGDAIADYVWGQASFSNNAPNRGSAATCDNAGLNLSSGYASAYAGVSVENGSNGQPQWVWVADRGNHRVLRFPLTSGAAANAVVGQGSFSDCSEHCGLNGTLNASLFCQPIDVQAVANNGHGEAELWVLNQDEGYQNQSFAFETRFFVYKRLTGNQTTSTCTTSPCWAYDRTRTMYSGFPQSTCSLPTNSANCHAGGTNCRFQGTGFTPNPLFDPNGANPDAQGYIWVTEHEADRATLINSLVNSGCNDDAVTAINSLLGQQAGTFQDGCPVAQYAACGQSPFDSTFNSYGSGGVRDPRVTGQVSDYRLCDPGGSMGFDDANNVYLSDSAFFRTSRFALPYTMTSGPGGIPCPPNPNGGALGPNLVSGNTISPSLGFLLYENPPLGLNQLGLKDYYRYLVWHNYLNLPQGNVGATSVSGSPDWFLGQSGPGSRLDRDNPKFGTRSYHTQDAEGRIWFADDATKLVVLGGEIGGSGQLPIPPSCAGCTQGQNGWERYQLRLYRADNSNIEFPYDAWGVAYGGPPGARGLWVADINRHRVFRVQNTNSVNSQKLLVDMVLGQTSMGGESCYQGGAPAPNRLCNPKFLAFDRFENLFVVENDYECRAESDRVSVFLRETLTSGAGLMFPNLNASKVFVAPDLTTAGGCHVHTLLDRPHSPIALGFDSANRMVLANDGDSQPVEERYLKQLHVYKNPTARWPISHAPDYGLCTDGLTTCTSNAACPSGKYCRGRLVQDEPPDGFIRLPMGAPGELKFSKFSDSLFVQDHTWTRLWMVNLNDDPQLISSWERDSDGDGMDNLGDPCPYVPNTICNETSTGSCTCFGDCDYNDVVEPADRQAALGVLLGASPVSACARGDRNGDGTIDVTDIDFVTNSQTNGCPPTNDLECFPGFSGSGSVKVGVVSGPPSATVSLPISSESAWTPAVLAGLQTDLTFNSSILTPFSPVACSVDAGAGNYEVTSRVISPGLLRVAIVPRDTSTYVTGPRMLAWCKFVIAPNAANGATSVQMQATVASNGAGTPQTVQITNGGVIVDSGTGCS